MPDNPYQSPDDPSTLDVSADSSRINQKYASYDDVPTFRKQWVFWVLYFPLTPVALIILISGDVYYEKKGRVRSFGLANKIVAAVIGIIWIFRMIKIFTGA